MLSQASSHYGCPIPIQALSLRGFGKLFPNQSKLFKKEALLLLTIAPFVSVDCLFASPMSKIAIRLDKPLMLSQRDASGAPSLLCKHIVL